MANVNECNYCKAAHTAVGKMFGLDVAELRGALIGNSEDPKVEAALQFARSIVIRQGWVSDEEFQKVHEAGYSHGEIVEIVATTAINIFSNYFNHVAGTEVDFPAVEPGAPTAVAAQRDVN